MRPDPEGTRGTLSRNQTQQDSGARIPPTPGMRVLCRDAEWLVTRVESSGGGHHAVHCLGADDLVRGHESIFLTQLDAIDPVDPEATRLIPDESAGFRMAKLYMEAQLRQTPATGVEPDLDGLGEAPIVTSRKLKPRELCFLCLGQIVSRTGIPLVADAHAISVHSGGRIAQRPLYDALDEIGFDSLINTGVKPNVQAAELLLKAVVKQSRHHMIQLKDRYSERVKRALEPEERRLEDWLHRRRELLQEKLTRLDEGSRQAETVRRELREIGAEVKDRRENWLDSYFRPAQEPTTGVVMVVEGIA